jgi:hypothetical protein
VSALFLSYRRDDSAGFAGRLADALEAAFGAGSVFRDVDDIRPGEDFTRAINVQLKSVDAVLVMIGPHWLAGGADGRRRLDTADDFVRMEIEAALASDKPVIPLLVGAARMPDATDLPPALAGLARRQAVVLSDSNWRGDVERLVASLRVLLPKPSEKPRARRWVLAGTAVAVLLGASAAFHFGTESRRPPSPVVAQSADSQLSDISGRWTARVKYDWGDQHDEVFEFKVLGNRLHGTASYLTGRLTIEHATLEGDWLRFTTRSQEMLGDSPWKEASHQYVGKVTPGHIEFTLETTGGYSVHPPVEFVARRVGK